MVIPPFYANINRDRLPDSCRVVVANPEPYLPEIAECSVPAGLAPGGAHTVELAVDVLPGAPTGINFGNALVGAGAGDREGFVTDNDVLMSIDSAAGATPGPSTGVDLWVSHDQPALTPLYPRATTLRYGNVGSAPTSRPATLVYVTPFHVNVDRTRPLPAGCVIQADHPDPLVPEIVVCEVPAGVVPGADHRMDIPLRLEHDGPAGMLAGRGRPGARPGRPRDPPGRQPALRTGDLGPVAVAD